MEKVDVGPDGILGYLPGVGTVVAAGPAPPADNTIDWAPSCIFIDSNATTDAGRILVNHGTRAAADFNSLASSLGPTLRLPSNSAPTTDYVELGGHTTAAAYLNTVGGTFSLQIDGAALASYTTSLIQYADGYTHQYLGAGTTTGEVVQRFGGTITEGMELRVSENTVSPVVGTQNTAVVTVPANSVILSVQSNVQTALTGGGTTVTYSVGVAADVDKYGTPAADALTADAKSNFIPAWTFLTSSEAVVVTGAATGGASAGDTNLTVGTVRVRVIYYALNSLDDA